MADNELDALYDEYHKWVAKGVEKGWIEGRSDGSAACLTHDGVPSTPAEDRAWDTWDPCQWIFRVWGPPGRAGQPTDLSL